MITGFPDASRASAGLPASLSTLAGQCTRCGLCRKNCSFLQRYGLPGDIAARALAGQDSGWPAAFACSLCSLCAAVCPFGLDPAGMFLDLRRAAFTTGKGHIPSHSRISHYERLGTSKYFTWYALPEGCTTVFFPGCTLPGTRPATTLKLYRFLRKQDKTVGIVLDCCTNPSHDLGKQRHFETMFAGLCNYLTSSGVRKVLAACPNCHKIFSTYGRGLQAGTVYEQLSDIGFVPEWTGSGTVTVHDPCAARKEPKVHACVRKLIRAHGLTISEMEHTQELTFCCGEGGAVVPAELSRQWSRRRREEAAGNLLLTYCAGCTGMLGRTTPTAHLLDLLFDPERTVTGRTKVYKAPFTYLNRLWIKKLLQREVSGGKTRERRYSILPAGNKKRGAGMQKLKDLLHSLRL